MFQYNEDKKNSKTKGWNIESSKRLDKAKFAVQLFAWVIAST